MNDGDVINFNSRKNQKDNEQKQPEKSTYEFHFHSMSVTSENGTDTELLSSEVVKADGFLKFGPQFVAVLDSVSDDSQIVLAVSTPIVKFVKKVGPSGEIQGTLAL